MLATTQPGLSVTRARAGPAKGRSPVSADTSSSAKAVNSWKSSSKTERRPGGNQGCRAAILVAVRSANSQEIGLGGELSAACEPLDGALGEPLGDVVYEGVITRAYWY